MECYFCQRNIRDIDFKETQALRKFISASGKIKSKKRTGICSSHQRRLARAIKRARYLALLSPIAK
ncbi:MAG: 30S ribosomal protein S18 [Candidatus Pacebacteria bacterium]|nr:30S ribosomal protein S18 [Candidatus Paceibacterota bacterium]